MAFDDYIGDDDEREGRGISPRIAPPNAVSALPPATLRGLARPTPAPPAPGSTEDLENRVGIRPVPIAKPNPVQADAEKAQNEITRLQTTGSGISQIQSPAKRGILRGLNIAGTVAGGLIPGVRPLLNRIPGTEEHNKYLIGQQEGRLGEDLGEQQKEAATEETKANTEKAEAEADKAAADAANLRNPQPKPKEEEWSVVPGMVGPKGEIVQQEKTSGTIRLVPQGEGVKPLKEPTEPEKDKDISDYLAAHNLTDTPANREKARNAIAQRGKQEPGSYMPLFDQKGQITGAWDPKTNHVIIPPKLPGTTIAGENAGEKNEQKTATANATINSFTRYQKSFHDLRPKLQPQDLEALQVLTSHQEALAHNLIEANVGGFIDAISGHLETGYTPKLMQGAMTKDQYDNMSREGKKMLADYSHAIIANFINMKQRMGTAGGRNQAMVQAEMNSIPLPYVDVDSADALLGDTIEDIRNYSGIQAEQAPPGGGGGQPTSGLEPPGPAGQGMKWQHRTTNGQVEWRQVPAQQP